MIDLGFNPKSDHLTICTADLQAHVPLLLLGKISDLKLEVGGRFGCNKVLLLH